MAIKRATMQDIADACGLSRNTVSKVFNGRGTVPEATRQMVLQKAQEIGYGQIPKEAPTMTEQPRKSVALLTCNMPRDFHFGTIFLPAFAERLSRSGYALVMYEITPEEQQRNALPSHMVPEQTAGIVCIELFNRVYMDMVCNLGIPVIFIDAYAGATLSVANCDTIYMENIASIIALTRHVVEKGAKSIGFIGKPDHCESFRERWEGFKTAMQ
jgi:LacI family transcriptional regulator